MDCVIIHSMLGEKSRLYPILLLINYWELHPSQMGARLDDLRKRGVQEFATFVPWQVVESDISHMLTRLLQAVTERKMKVFLILSPEVGIHYPYSGLPKDIVTKKDNKAQHVEAGMIPVFLPPHAFTLPSLFSPELNKRYYSFLSRMDGLFFDLFKNQLHSLQNITAILSGSFWKYYRSPRLSSQLAFGGSAGDYSHHASLAYRQRIESFFSQREFMDPNPTAATRWKVRGLEETNRKWFYQHAEDVFRTRSTQMIGRKSIGLPVAEMELFTPEADPSMLYSHFLRTMGNGYTHFEKLSTFIDEAAPRRSVANVSFTPSYIHWSSMGGFRMLTEAEKQFLILKSLLRIGTQGGGILMNECEWFACSSSFRNRAEILAQSISNHELELNPRILYLVPHLWSAYGTFWEELVKKMGTQVVMIASSEFLIPEQFAQLLIIDPSFIFTKVNIQKITSWAQAGRVVVIPRTLLYTESARRILNLLLEETQRIDVDLGLSYSLHSIGDGKLVAYTMPDGISMQDETLSIWKTFLNSILSIAEVNEWCRTGNSQLSLIPLDRKKEDIAVFVLNETRHPVTADIIFPKKVIVSDLGVGLTETEGSDPLPIQNELAQANRFSLEVPALGVLPLAIEGLQVREQYEHHLAALTNDAMRENSLKAAAAELPGLNITETIEDLWN